MASSSDEDIMEDPNPQRDDEARMCLYAAEDDTVTSIPFLLHGFPGNPIRVDGPDLDRNIRDAVQNILRFALPDWIMKLKPCPEPQLLIEQSKARLDLIKLHYNSSRWPKFSNECALLPSGLPFELLLHRALSLSVVARLQCATEYAEAELLTPSLLWTPAYDMIFEYIEHDVLRDVNIAASFRPRWSVYPNQPHGGDWPVVIPDVVFSVQIPESEPSRSPFTARAHRFHPAHEIHHKFDGSLSPLLEVPLLLVEYNKCWGSTRNVGVDPHLDHLLVGMTAALALYDALGIRTPVFGLFTGTVYEFSLFAGVIEDGEPMIREVHIAKYYRSVFDVSNSIQLMHLYALLGNLQTLSAKVSLHLTALLDGKEADLSPLLYEWPTTVPPTERRRVIDSARPPLVVDDPLLQFLFVSSTPRIADWLRRGRLTLVARPALIASLPSHVRDWLHLCTATNPVSFAVVRDAVEDSKKGMSRRVQALADTFWSAHGTDVIGRGAPDAPDGDQTQLRYISDNLLYSLSACARALDLLHSPLTRGHTLTNNWLTLYRTLFTEAARCCDVLILRYNHAWAVHRRLRLEPSTLDELDTLNLDVIRPEMAFVMPVESICWRREQEWRTHRESSGSDHAHRVFADLCVYTDAEADTHDTLPVGMPVFVVEYVLTPDNPTEREKHMHQLASTAAVLGFLLDCNTVNVFVGWMDQNECIIQELSDTDFTFDISKPSDSYSLFALLRLQGSRTLIKHVNAVIDAHVGEAISAAFREDYHSWKEPKRYLSSFFDLKEPVASTSKMQAWLSGIPKGAP
ncbi:hypothetical protein CPB85DRAFT_1308341 [Mucidula mucida]|nr:hypothetical protein CPB85DRAFT_1308341 [Mucidula mucida]